MWKRNRALLPALAHIRHLYLQHRPMNVFFALFWVTFCFLFSLATRVSYAVEMYTHLRRISSFLAGISAMLAAIYFTDFPLWSTDSPYPVWELLTVVAFAACISLFATLFWYLLSWLFFRTRYRACDAYNDSHAFRLLSDDEN